MENTSNKTQNIQKSTKFADEILGGNISEETKAQIAEEIQSTVLRHLTKMVFVVMLIPCYVISFVHNNYIINPTFWK